MFLFANHKQKTPHMIFKMINGLRWRKKKILSAYLRSNKKTLALLRMVCCVCVHIFTRQCGLITNLKTNQLKISLFYIQLSVFIAIFEKSCQNGLENGCISLFIFYTTSLLFGIGWYHKYGFRLFNINHFN